VAKPPAPVLFDVQSESSTIKQGKDGSYKLVMKDVERVHWETDEAEAEEGYYSAKKYAKTMTTITAKMLRSTPMKPSLLQMGRRRSASSQSPMSNTTRRQTSLSTTSSQRIKSRLTRSQVLKVNRKVKVLCIQQNALVGVLIGCRTEKIWTCGIQI